MFLYIFVYITHLVTNCRGSRGVGGGAMYLEAPCRQMLPIARAAVITLDINELEIFKEVVQKGW